MFSCKKCNYNTNDKSNYNKHLLTKKHKKSIEKSDNKSTFSEKTTSMTTNDHKMTTNDHKMTTNDHKMTTNDHKNEHKKCSSKSISKFFCDYCNKQFSSKPHKRRHELHYCKENKLHNKLIISENKLKEEKKEKKKLYKTIEKLLEENGKAYTQNNNTYNNTINTTNNIVLNSYGYEDLTHITDKILTNLIKGPNMMISELAKLIHFNDAKPENMNVFIPNKRDKYVQIYRGTSWVLENKKETIPDMVDKSYYMLDNHYDNIKDTLDTFTKKNYKIIQQAYDTKDNKIMKDQYEQVEMELLNNSKKVLEYHNN